ncbi:hypothetical protein SAMN02927900_05961 [Rhizobium mongolense subsp. loessense]|uniref:Uncharacterized protein n=1 Tax=Rhizobium mongolense subsp. loessense TaxID=158890 RepID=A0A1G4U1L6_9HYPH|nr:hypothetical protein SAMN02927900_05961 [Rhizobium mongolense subsp. loessense]
MKIDPVYAFELDAGSDELLGYEATEEDARKAALAHLRELWVRDRMKIKVPTAIYKVWLNPIDTSLLLDIMNFPDERADWRLVERKERIAVVTQ